MAITWSLIATLTSRPADNSLGQQLYGRVDTNRIIFYVREDTVVKLWRSDDRGVTWAFHDVTGTTGSGTRVTGPSKVYDSKFWIYDDANSKLIHTPSTNPGAGGFTSETPGGDFSVAATPMPTESSSFLYLADEAAGGTPVASMHRRTAASTFTELTINQGDTWNIHDLIPGTADLLMSEANATVARITPSSSPVTIVNQFTPTDGLHVQTPGNPAVALTSTDYWVSAAGAAANPANIYRTTNGGTSWSATNPTSGFWEAFAGGGRQAHGTGFIRFGGSDYCLLTFKDAGVPDHDRKHVKVAKFNGTTWDTESNDTNDTFRVIAALSGTNSSGDLDFYAITYDSATDTARVYRATVTQIAAGVLTSRALAWDFRELPVSGSRWTYHTPFNVGAATETGGRTDTELIHFVKNNEPTLIEFPSGTTDEGTAITWKWKSRAYAFGAMLWEKGIRQIAPILLSTTGTVTVNVYKALASAVARAYSLTYSGGAHERQTTKRAHADLQDQVMQVELTGTAATFEATGIEIEPLRKRRPR